MTPPRPPPRLRAALLAAAIAAWLGLAAGAPVALAADAVTFGQPTATSSFGASIEFKQPVTTTGTPLRVEILLTTPGAIGPSVVPQPPGTTSGATILDYRVDVATGGHIVPNTTFTARWRVTDATGRTWVGPALQHVYADDRFTWKSLGGSVVRLHWVDGDQAFGQRALRIGDDAVASAAKLLGVTESDPIDIFVYGDQQAFYEALGPATRENVGGQAHPDIRTLFALIAPADINASWVESVVPHELTHVVFQTAVDNPYHDPPHWLNEGLAVYLSDGFDSSNRAQVKQAATDGSIIPLDGLAGAFPTTQDRFFLAYAESVSAVDRIIRVSGRDALVKLIRSYHDGVSDDQAFQAALGRDLAGFEADWLAELGARPPIRLGPRPAPIGPLPAGWAGPQPNPSFEVTGSQPPIVPSAPRPVGRGDDPVSFLAGPLASVGLVVVVVVVAIGLRRLGRRPDPAADTGDNRLFGRGPVETDEAPESESGDGPDLVPPSRLWASSDWSLPRDADGSGGEPPAAPAGGPVADAAPAGPSGRLTGDPTEPDVR